MGRFNEDTTIGGKSILDFIYPVGSIYYTTDDAFNPNEYWGGTWEEINDRFIYGTSVKTEGNNNHLSKQTGGEKTHKLTVNEMPNHSHKVRYTGGSANGVYGGMPGTSVDKEPAYNHLLVEYEGGGASHNNMPPYYTAHIWHRTA